MNTQTYWRIIIGQNALWISEGKPEIGDHGEVNFIEALHKMPTIVSNYIFMSEMTREDAARALDQARAAELAAAQPQPQPEKQADAAPLALVPSPGKKKKK